MEETGYVSYKIGELSEGCKRCMIGRKSVLLITGVCPENCFYCPLSEQKKNKDVIYINEIPIYDEKNRDEDKAFSEIIKEIKLCNSTGTGITGGDPLAKIDRTCKYIKNLKEKFGKEFHIHLYTPFKLVNEENLKKLYSSGLDEIRFQAFLRDYKSWEKINLALKYDWKVGIEIPMFPNRVKETIELIEFFKDKVDFFNLNELEVSHTNEEEMMKKGYHIRNGSPSAVEKSFEKGKEVLEYFEKNKINVNIHLCTASLKDGHQLKNRLLLRAKSIAKEYDTITEEGLLLRGTVYLKNLYPSIKYKEKLKEIKKVKQRYDFHMKKLNEIRNNIIKIGIKEDSIGIDKENLCIYVPYDNIEEIKKAKLKDIKYGWMEIYPTYDNFITELDILN